MVELETSDLLDRASAADRPDFGLFAVTEHIHVDPLKRDHWDEFDIFIDREIRRVRRSRPGPPLTPPPPAHKNRCRGRGTDITHPMRRNKSAKNCN